jgi:hypothetical protein
MRILRALLVLWWSLLFLPADVDAQVVTATIAGVVRDASGAVIPGVTVEARSPVLIERVRTTVTDGQGLYRIVDLRPGPYSVTFTLAGFNTLIRNGIELTAGFTATVNADLAVGSLEESITVSGAAPMVDTQNVRQQTTLSREVLDALPTTRRVAQLITIIPGATAVSATLHDVGGVGSERSEFAIHGQRANQMTHNQAGMDHKMQSGGGFSQNVHTFQEVGVETLAGSAEASTGGILVNVVPKDGGNVFSGSFSTDHTGPDMQSANITDELRTRGLGPAPSVRSFMDIGGGLGGPIKRDTLWFFGAVRYLERSQYQQGNYFNKRQGTLFYEPDLDRPAYTDDWDQDYTVRFTWQAAAKHKVTAAHTQHPSCQCFYGLLESATGILLAPEATGAHHYDPNYLSAATWTYPVTNRLLIEAAGQVRKYNNHQKRQPDLSTDIISVRELSSNIQYGSRASSYRPQPRQVYRERFAVSYITGSHAFKTGIDLNQFKIGMDGARFNDPHQINQAIDYTFRDQIPQSLRIWAVPFGTLDTSRDLAVFVQDQWTVRKLTLNLGIRFSDFDSSIPEYSLPPGPYVEARTFPAVKHSPHWTNLNPRLGVAYDLFGTGQTAVKASLGRYARNLDTAVNNPVSNQASSTSRNWNDSNRNYVPDCDLRNPLANGECGAWSDLTFGLIRESNTRFADDAVTGFNRQPDTSWQGSVSVQHELRPGVGLNVGYFRTWYVGFAATDNQAIMPADFDEFCITAPVDSRLPNSGQQLCGLYDLRPGVFGLTDNLVTQASHYGTQTEVYNGVDVTLSARFAEGGQLSGGLSTGRTVTDECFVVDSPQQARDGFCNVTPPWSAGTQVKFAAVYPLPWELQASAIYQNIPGIPITASYVATNAQIASSLGRNLGSCRGAATCNGTVTVELIPANSAFEDRLQQVDLRFTRTLRLPRNARVQGSFDVYNLFNANSILNMNTRYGSSWQNVIQIMGGRLFKFSARLDF